jgi:hypothetical protein
VRIDKRTTLWATAVHEAGHAVFAVFLDIPNLRRVTTIPGEGYRGRVDLPLQFQFFCSELERRLAAKKAALMLMAGAIAQESAKGGRGAYPSDADLSLLTDMAGALGYEVPELTDALSNIRFWYQHPFCSVTRKRVYGLMNAGLQNVVMAFAETLYREREIEGHRAMDIIKELLGRDSGWEQKRWQRESARYRSGSVINLAGEALEVVEGELP